MGLGVVVGPEVRVGTRAGVAAEDGYGGVGVQPEVAEEGEGCCEVGVEVPGDEGEGV